MKYALIITGFLAGLAIAAPKLVVLGYFLLIIPGLILTIAPTVFVYLVTTAVVRKLLPISSPVTSTLAAFGIALLIGWAVMQPFRYNAIAAYQENELPDIVPNEAIKLTGDVRIERPDHRREPDLDYLSLAVLDSPVVKSVTTITAGHGKPSDTRRSAAYTLNSAKRNSAVGIYPSKPGQITRKYSPLSRAFRGTKIILASKAVEANWAMRLAGNERLSVTEPIKVELADWVIRIDNRSKDRTSKLKRVTILDSQGTVRYHKTYRNQAVPARMFYIGFDASMSGGTISGASFHLGRQILKSGDSALEPESTLLQAIKFSVPPCDAGVLKTLRAQVEQSLDDPAATAAQLDLAKRYLGLFFFDTKASDYALIARIVADQRVRDIETQIKNVFSKKKTPVEMRDAFVDRISMDHTSAKLRHLLAERLASLPPGTFANPSPNYLAIWKSPTVYQEAAPLIATLADMNPQQAMLLISRILDDAVALSHWHERRTMIHGIQAALIRLGPQASSAAPRIRELYLSRPSPIMNNSNDAGQWRFALARMGVAIEDLPVFPNQSPKSVERNSRQVVNKLKRFEQANNAAQQL